MDQALVVERSRQGTAHSRVLGRVSSVRGAQLSAALDPGAETMPTARMGALVKMKTPVSTVFGEVDIVERRGDGNGHAAGIMDIDLLGEAMATGDEDATRFQRGVSIYPLLGTPVEPAESADIAQVYAKPSSATVRFGAIYQDPSVPAYLMIDPLLGKHFAVLGTTGSGKSCAVALVLRAILSQQNKGHVVLIDAHNEYSRAFPDMAEVSDIRSLQLPFWLFDFEEAVGIFVRGGTASEQESQKAILKEAILAAKRKYSGEKMDPLAITVDTPVPYRLVDLIKSIDDSMARLDKPDNSVPYLRLKHRLESLNDDRRFAFMFPRRLMSDNLDKIIARVMRIPVEDKPLSIIDISGVPSEVVDVVVSMLCRMIFDFALWAERDRAQPILLVCEEAHRYIPANESLGFEATRRAMTRIAKEGRKYGVALCLVTQRPSELSPSILSQCGTMFALRMNNEQDQTFVARALPDNAHRLLGVLPELRTQEALVVGEGVSVPMRVRLDTLAPERQPRSESARFSDLWAAENEGAAFVEETINKWRNQIR
ncbi:MAG: DUF87 domain-containing protein [Alphaproteobacteria bacterium]